NDLGDIPPSKTRWPSACISPGRSAILKRFQKSEETKMKSMTSKLLTLAATLAIAATTASAQVTLKAAIPFSFEISGHQVLPAGSYSVRREGHVWQFTNVDTRNKALAPATVGME